MHHRARAFWRGWVVLMTLGIAPFAAGEGQESVGAIHFDAPAGWKTVDQPGKSVRMYVPPDVTATDQAMIIVAFGDAGGEFRAQFDQMINAAMASRKVLKRGLVQQGRSRQGLPVLSQNITAEGENGMMILARFIAADVNGRPALLCYVATLPDAYESHHTAVERMMASVSFGEAPPAAANEMSKAPAGPATDEPPQKSPEQWARDADKRRKPHTVLGDIVNTQGKPIKGAKGYIYVGGTTLRGDRSSFSLELDENGHFEMAVPDGVYRLSPTFSVEYDGKTMPVQLVPVDGKSMGQSFGSADGIVRDYRWVMTGRRPNAVGDSYVNYFGGHLTFSDLHQGDFRHQVGDHWPAGTKVRILLTPTGPLIDGSEGRPAGFEMDVRQLASLAPQAGGFVPIGVYKADAELVTPDGTRHGILMSLSPGGAQRAPQVEIHFKLGVGDAVDNITIWFADGPG